MDFSVCPPSSIFFCVKWATDDLLLRWAIYCRPDFFGEGSK